MLKAAYKHQLSIKDPTAYIHNAKYVMQLLYGSLTDINTKLSKPVDLSKIHR